MDEHQSTPAFDRSEPDPKESAVYASRAAESLGTPSDSQSARDPGAQGEAALRAVRAIKTMGFDEADLLALADRVDDQALPVLGLIGARLEQREAPLALEDQSLAAIYMALLDELATLHLRLVDEGLAHRAVSVADAGPRLRRTLALNYTLSLHLWRLYQVEPEGFWWQVRHALQLAERLGAASALPTEAERRRTPGVASVEALVARISVIASSDVYALRRGDVLRLAQWLEKLPLECVEAVPSSGGEETVLIRLALDEDRPPSLIMGKALPDANTRYVDLSAVLRALDSNPEELMVPGAAQARSARLDQRLRRRWIVPPMRQFRREPADFGPLITATGLQSIHAMIRADLGYQRTLTDLDSDLLPGGLFAPEGGDPQQVPSLLSLGDPGSLGPANRVSANGEDPTTATEIGHLSDRALERVMRVWESALRALDTASADPAPVEIDARPRPTVSWLKNVGAGGCCLHLQSPADTIACGNLIAIRITEQERTLWPLGVICWLRYDDADGVTVGVQYLSQNCVPTEIRLDEIGTDARAMQPGLFFQEYGRGNTAILLQDPGTLGADQRIRFTLGGVEYTATLDSVRPESQTFWRVGFSLGAGDRSANINRMGVL
jgi:hypothetical protein